MGGLKDFHAHEIDKEYIISFSQMIACSIVEHAFLKF